MVETKDFGERTYGQWWQIDEETVQVPLTPLRAVCLKALTDAGASEADAAFLLDIRLDKALQGDHARGLRGLAGLVRAARKGDISLRPEIRILRETPGTALVEGDPKTPGVFVCRAAMDLAIAKARQNGVGWASARSMAAILTPHVLQATDAGFVGMVLTQSYPTVAPTGGFQPLLGNGPIAFGIPAGDHDPVILDMSMTESSASGVLLAARQGQQVPAGALLDETGEPTTDARAFPAPEHYATGVLKVRGTLNPLGGSHKAYAMIFVIGLLSAVLADASPPWERDPDAPSEQWQYGSLHLAVDPAAFLQPDEFRRRVDAFIDRVKSAPKRPGVSEINYPGEGSQRLKRHRRESGALTLPRSHYEEIRALAAEVGLPDAL
jgi:LDH2 family malate/lactate/ureidoglycolate dehydrogenase